MIIAYLIIGVMAFGVIHYGNPQKVEESPGYKLFLVVTLWPLLLFVCIVHHMAIAIMWVIDTFIRRNNE